MLAQLGGDLNKPTEENPQYLQAKAQVDKAERDLRRTIVRAPVTSASFDVSVTSRFSVSSAGTDHAVSYVN